MRARVAGFTSVVCALAFGSCWAIVSGSRSSAPVSRPLPAGPRRFPVDPGGGWPILPHVSPIPVHAQSLCLGSRYEGRVSPEKWGDPLPWFQKPSKHKKKKHKKEKEERSKDKKKSRRKPLAGDGAAGPVENGTLEEEPLPVRAAPAPGGPAA